MSRIQSVLMVSVIVVESAVLALLTERTAQLRRNFVEVRAASMTPHAGGYFPRFDGLAVHDDTTIHVGIGAKGQRQLVLYYSRTCDFCRASLGAWKRLISSVGSTPSITPIVIAVDSGAATRDSLRRAGISVPVILFPSRRERVLARGSATPQTLLVDSDGRILASHTGFVTDSVLDVVRRAAARVP